jgi:hypothetical protein
VCIRRWSILFFVFQLSACLFPQPALQGTPLARSHDSGGSKHAQASRSSMETRDLATLILRVQFMEDICRDTTLTIVTDIHVFNKTCLK